MIDSRKVLALVLVLSTTLSSHAWDEEKDRVVGSALAVGAAVAIGYAAYSVINWLSERTDEEVIKDCRSLCSQGSNYYRLRDSFVYHLGRESRYSSTEYTLGLLEDIYAHIGNFTADYYLSEMHKLLSAMQSEQKVVIKRMNKARGKQEYVYRDFHSAYNQLTDQVISLEPMYHFMKAHLAYFNLRATEQSLAKYYYNELTYMNAYYQGQIIYDFNSMIHQKFGNEKYPYLSYFAKISADVKRIEDENSSLRYNYSPLKENTKKLAHSLNMFAGFVRSHERFGIETRDQQIEEMQRKQLEIQKQLLAIEKQKAAAAAQKAQELAHQNWLKQQELALKQQELYQQKQQQQQQNNNQRPVTVDYTINVSL